MKTLCIFLILVVGTACARKATEPPPQRTVAAEAKDVKDAAVGLLTRQGFTLVSESEHQVVAGRNTSGGREALSMLMMGADNSHPEDRIILTIVQQGESVLIVAGAELYSRTQRGMDKHMPFTDKKTRNQLDIDLGMIKADAERTYADRQKQAKAEAKP